MSVWLAKKMRSKGTVWQVNYRRGGREAPQVYDSTWPTKTLANERKMVILAAWAQGKPIPPIHPEIQVEQTLAQVIDDYANSRRDVGPSRQKHYQHVKRHLGPLRDRSAASVTPTLVRAWVDALEASLAPASIRAYVGILREVFDHAEIEPNPAKHPSVRLPKANQEIVNPPTTSEFAQMVDAITPRHRFALILIEGTGLRVNEVAKLTWGDIDASRSRLRVLGTKTKAATRWVPIEDSLMFAIFDSCPHEDRTSDRAIIPNFNDQTFRNAVARSARDANIAHYSPHDIRHRYVSMLVQAQVPVPIVAKIVGHSKSSMTLDTYSHVLIDEDPSRLATLRRLAIELASGSGAGSVLADTLPALPQNDENPVQDRVLDQVEDTGIVRKRSLGQG